MSDDKSKTDNRDRNLVAGNEEYEVSYFASKHNLTLDEARKLISDYGNNRIILDEAAKELKRLTR